MKTASDPRHHARILAFQHLFEYFFEETIGQSIDQLSTESISLADLTELDEISKYDKDLYKSVIDGVKKDLKEIDTLIVSYAPEWPIEQMSKTDLQILRVGVWEGFVGKITPPKVAIDESIEIAKEFGGEKSSKFVNGVLGAIIQTEKDAIEKNEKPE
jgi:N utilization substance protein B